MRPTAKDEQWRRDALCRGMDPAIWFPHSTEVGAQARAKALCNECPSIWECRFYALKAREPDGVWGGLTEKDRHRIWRAERKTG